MTEQTPSDPDLLTRIEDAAFATFAEAAWDVLEGSTRPVNRSANAVYHARRNGDGLFLRVVHEQGTRSLTNLIAVQEFQLHLVGLGAPVSRPLASTNGDLVRRFEQGPDAFLVRAEGQVHGEVFAPIEVGRERGDSGFQELGRALAQLHEASLTFAQTVDFDQHSWRRELAAIARYLPEDDEAGVNELAIVRAELESLDPAGPNYGLTHGDINCGNVIWDGARCHIIDFDCPMWNWFAADVVRPMRDYRTWPLPERRRILAAIVRGYRSIRSFDDAWVAQLPLFQRFKQLEMYAWTASGFSMAPTDAAEDDLFHNRNVSRRASYLTEARNNFRAPLEF